MEGGGLGGGGRAGEQGFGVGGEVLAAVGRVEAFREDDEGGAGAGGFEDAVTRSGEVGGFVGACGWGVRWGWGGVGWGKQGGNRWIVGRGRVLGAF